MQTTQGKQLAYGMTSDGVMVQVQRGKLADAEWDGMVEAIRRDAAQLRAIIVVATGSEGPTATQRKQVAEVAATYPHSFRGVAVLTDSIIVRGALTAIAWLIPGRFPSRAFSLDDLDGALRFLGLNDLEAAKVRALISKLDERRQAAM